MSSTHINLLSFATLTCRSLNLEMGTLTAGQPRLDNYCEHKLPTSCRLSSIGECCACYDERAHSASYSTYIDGVGFVQRGTRWQRYCWFCKEYWENRVRASGLTPGQTRIPERPDQTEFLQRWYEFHQGYRIALRSDGTEERVAVLGEDLRDVSPGCLPRTLNELRAGRERSEIEERERAEHQRQQQAARAAESPAGPTLEESLDQMFEAAEREESQSTLSTPRQAAGTNVHAQAITPAGSRSREYQVRRITALRSELHRMRRGIERVISGLRDLGETVPDHTDASNRLSQLGNTLDSISALPSQEDAQSAINSVHALTEAVPTTRSDRNQSGLQARIDEARQHVEDARRSKEQAATELDLAEQELRASQSRLRQLQNEQRTTENYVRLFGTREDMAAQGENYESPIGGMFSRAMERFRVAEEVRREERTLRQVLHDEEQATDPDVIGRLAELETRERDVWGVPRSTEPSLHQTAITQYMPTPTNDPQTTSDSRSAEQRVEANERNVHQVESPLEEYMRLLRRSTELDTAANNFPRNMLNAVPSQRAPGRTLTDMIAHSRTRRTRIHPENVVAGPPGNWLDDNPYQNNDRGLDAVFVLTALANNTELRTQIPFAIDGSTVANLLRSAEDNRLTEADVAQIRPLVELEEIVWGSRLPAERNRRRRERGETVSFNPEAFEMAMSGQVVVHDVEMMAECYSTSGQVRAQSGIPALEQLPMLYRLQAGERNSNDRAVLVRMLRSDTAMNQASQVLAQQSEEASREGNESRTAYLDNQRRQAAREGNHSRSELDAQRRAARTIPSVALTASRAAMAAGPTALLERMANRDEETRAAYERLRENGFVPNEETTSRRLRDALYRDFGASPDATDSDEDEDAGRGLDAKDSGRPEDPMTEDDMTVLLDCRICYSQKADICTIPCGHLAMCRWCSEQHSPTMTHDRTRPRRPAACPVCRKQIRQKIQVHRS